MLRFCAGALALAISLLACFPAYAGRSEFRPYRYTFSGAEWANPHHLDRFWLERGAKAKRHKAKRAKAKRPGVSRPSRKIIRRAIVKAPASPGPIAELVKAAAAAAGVPVKIALAVVAQESGFRPHLVGSAGEIGLAQIKPATAREVGFRGSRSALFEPRTNLQYGMRYLRRALDRGGQGCAGVTLYNSGIYARPHCSRYGRQVMSRVR